MNNQKVHAGGRQEHLKSLKETLEKLLVKIKKNKDLTPAEKEVELVKAKTSYKKEIKNLNDKLF